MIVARQSTARTVMIGPVLDADGVAVTDAVVADFEVSKNGGDPAALNGSATLTHRNTGHYSLALTASDLDTVGQAEIVINDAANACQIKVLTVVEEAVYDMLFAASALGYIANAPVNVAQFGGTNGTFASGRPEVNTTHWAGTAVGSANVRANVVQIAGQTASASGTVTFPNATLASTTNITGGTITTVTNLTNLPAAAATAAELAKVPKSDSTVTWNATALASINTQADLALSDYDPPTNAEMVARTLTAASYATAAAQATAQADLDTLTGSDGVTLATTQPNYAPATAAGLATAQSDLDTITGSDGVTLATTQGNYAPSTAAALATAQGTIDKLDDTLEDDGGTFRFTANALEQAPSGGGGITVQDIVDGVWDEPIASHVDSGSAGEALSAAGGAGDPWITALPGAYSAGQAGYIVGTNLNATVSSRATQTSVDTIDSEVGTIDGIVDAIVVDTQDIQSRIPAALVGGRIDATVDGTGMEAGAVTAIQSGLATAAAVADLPTNAELATALDPLPTAAENATAVWAAGTRVLTAGTNIVLAKGTGVTGFNDLSAAQVNAEADQALADYDPPTRAELTTDTNSVLTAVGDLPTNAELATALDPLPTAAENASALLAATVEGSTTVVQSMRLANSALGGKASGLETTEATYRDLADTKDRIVATVDEDGNRTAVTRDLT